MGQIHPAIIAELEDSADFFGGYTEDPGARFGALLRYAGKIARHINFGDGDKAIRTLAKIACMATAWAYEINGPTFSKTLGDVYECATKLGEDSRNDRKCLTSLSYLITAVGGGLDTGMDHYLVAKLTDLAAGAAMWATYLHGRPAGFGIEQFGIAEADLLPRAVAQVYRIDLPEGTVIARGGSAATAGGNTIFAGGNGAGSGKAGGGNGSNAGSAPAPGAGGAGGGNVQLRPVPAEPWGGAARLAATEDVIDADFGSGCAERHPWCQSPYVKDENYNPVTSFRNRLGDVHHEISVLCQEEWKAGHTSTAWSLWDLQKLLSRELDAHPRGFPIHLDWWMSDDGYAQLWAALKEAAVWSPALAKLDKEGQLPAPSGETRQPAAIREEFETRNDEVLARSSAAFQEAAARPVELCPGCGTARYVGRMCADDNCSMPASICKIINCHCGSSMPASRKGTCQVCGCPDLRGRQGQPIAGYPGWLSGNQEQTEELRGPVGDLIGEAISRGLNRQSLPGPLLNGDIPREELTSLVYDAIELLDAQQGTDFWDRQSKSIRERFEQFTRILPWADLAQREDVEEAIGLALGRASVAWTEVPQGEFDSATCGRLVSELMELVDSYVNCQPVRDTDEVAGLVKSAKALIRRARNIGVPAGQVSWLEDAATWDGQAASWLARFVHPAPEGKEDQK